MRVLPTVAIDFDPKSVKEYVKLKYNIVVVDVLRATSTIIVILAQGTEEIIPCAEIEEAKSYKKNENTLLVGERHSEIIPGFDFTNSPSDLSKENLTGKLIAITTSTGTRVISESIGARNILIGSTLNAKAVAHKMSTIKGKWVVIGAGTRGDFRPEDKVGCAIIADYYCRLTNAIMDYPTKDIVNTFTKNVSKHIRTSLSSQKLIAIGRKYDVDFVINKLNKYHIVPTVRIKNIGRLERLSISL